jgi:hypothetical protein
MPDRRSEEDMRKIQVILGLCAICIAANTVRGQTKHIYLIKAFNCNGGPAERSQTGFRIQGLHGIITALHGVAGCRTIKAQSETGTILFDVLSLGRADFGKDVALLISSELSSLPADGLPAATEPEFASLESIKVAGHPFGIKLLNTQLLLRDPPTKALRDLLDSDSLAALTARKSPDPAISVLSVQGTLLPGHSGAPVFNSKNLVIGVANGGLKGGTTEITWAIPISSIEWQPVEPPLTQRINQVASLHSGSAFSFDENIPPLFPIIQEETKTFSKGEMKSTIVVSADGNLQITTHIRGTNTVDGFCGHISVWFFDKAGNRLGTFGMGPDHQWCVGSGIEATLGGGARTRVDRQDIPVPKDVINQTASVSIIQLEGPGKNSAELIKTFLNQALSSRRPVQQ